MFPVCSLIFQHRQKQTHEETQFPTLHVGVVRLQMQMFSSSSIFSLSFLLSPSPQLSWASAYVHTCSAISTISGSLEALRARRFEFGFIAKSQSSCRVLSLPESKTKDFTTLVFFFRLLHFCLHFRYLYKANSRNSTPHNLQTLLCFERSPPWCYDCKFMFEVHVIVKFLFEVYVWWWYANGVSALDQMQMSEIHIRYECQMLLFFPFMVGS